MKASWRFQIPFLLIAVATGVAAAQPAGEKDSPPEFAPRAVAQWTPAQMLEQVGRFMPAMDDGSKQVQGQLTTAREDSDVVKVLCLNDKLTQINVAIRSAQDRAESLRGAVSRDDRERALHEFTVMQVLRDRVRELLDDAGRCIGEDVGFVGEPKVTVEVDPTIPPADPTELPDLAEFSQPPVLSSPIQ